MNSPSSATTSCSLYEQDSVYGMLHTPQAPSKGGVVLTHSASGNCEAPLLIAVAAELAAGGYHVLRCNLPFRQRRPSGPPHPSTSKLDRDGLRLAVAALRKIAPGKVILGGHSYGGRQASILAAEDKSVADSLLLLSYPLHPPAKPDALRTAHFPQLKVPGLFVHGSKDGFGTFDEMQAALQLIPAASALWMLQGAGHDLARGRFDIQQVIAKMF